MPFKPTMILLSTAAVLALNGCGGGDGSNTSSTQLVGSSTNQAPVATNLVLSASSDAPVYEDTPYNIELNATDDQDATLSYTLLTQPTHGTISLNNGVATYTPETNYNGEDSFTYQACDSQGLCSNTAIVSIEIVALNDTPQGEDDSATTDEDSAVTIDVLSNDSDIDGDSLSITNLSTPSHGSVEVKDGKVVYTPEENYNGTDSFTYSPNDGTTDGNSVTVSVTINTHNDAPVAVAKDVSLDEDSTVEIEMSGSDVDGDALTFEVKTAPAHGTYENGIYTPEENYNGTDSFTYIANDGTVDSEEANITITIDAVNDAPVAEDVVTSMWAIGSKNALNASDIEDDTLIYETTSDLSFGTLDENGLYTPDADASGTERFTYHACDADACSEDANVTIVIKAPFIEVYDTSVEANTTSTQLKIAKRPGNDNFNIIIDWGDGDRDYNVTETTIHNYESEGNYTVKIAGTYESWFGEVWESEDGDKTTYYDAPKLQSIEQWGDIAWDSMYYAFFNCYNMDGNANDMPDLSNVTSLASMFYVAKKFNQEIDDWNVTTITNVSAMFMSAESFNQSLNSWDVSHIESMGHMFYGATNFNGDISNWDVGNVTYMYGLFMLAKSFNQDISNWDIGSVTSTAYMFYHAESFNQPIGDWNVENVTTMDYMFHGVTLSTDNYDALLIGWSERELQRDVPFDAGDSKYSTDAEEARQSIIDNYNWTVTDGGEE